MTELTPAQKNFCLYCGLFGLMIGLACIIQHFFVWDADWDTMGLIIPPLTGLTAFVLLIIKKRAAGIFLILACVLLMARLIYFAYLSLDDDIILLGISQFFFFIGILHILYFIYTFIIIVLYFSLGYPRLFKMISDEKRAEQAFWDRKLN